MKINIFIHLIFVAACLSVNAQQIQNIRFEQEGKKINIYYDLLSGESGQKYDIQVYCSTDGGSTWGSPLQTISGAVGENQKAGKDKKIIWDVLAEKEKLTGNIKFKINAVSSEFSNKSGTFIDSRDGQKYKWVRIGNQVWMAQNLNIGKKIRGKAEQENNGVIEKYCYKNNNTNCDEYGGLYQWDEMMQYTTTQGIQGICPNGWHIPTDNEWRILEGTVDSQYPVEDPEWDGTVWRGYNGGLNIKSTSGWHSGGNGTDLYGFAALPGGCRYGVSGFDYLGSPGYFWSSTEGGTDGAWFRLLGCNDAGVGRNDGSKDVGISVRCLQD